MKLTAVIMAGGRGERFWPRSRTAKPKQFLSLTADKETMLQKTVNRLKPLLEMDAIYVVTNQRYAALVQEQLPELPAENILPEPCSRNTAPCIGLAAAVIQKRCGEAMMLVLPSDHLIRYESLYVDTLRQAIAVAEQGERLVTIGIPPTYPETGYGYIRFANRSESHMPGVYPVEKFVEKPDLDTAKEYLAAHCYLWNSGMFVWKSSTILHNLEQFLPTVYAGSMEIAAADGTDAFSDTLERVYEGFPSESVDYGIMEKADNVYVSLGDFGWSDLGTWGSLYDLSPKDEAGNVALKCKSLIYNSKDNIVVLPDNKLAVIDGLEGYLIAESDNVLLICKKDEEHTIRKYVNDAQIKLGEEYI